MVKKNLISYRLVLLDRFFSRSLRWEIYVKEKGGLIKRDFLVSVPHLKGGNIVWTCVKEHIIDEKEQYKYIVRDTEVG